MLSDTKISKLLAHISSYVTLTKEEEELFFSKVKVKKYLKGQFVVQEGDVCMYQNFVLSGALKSFYMNNKGHEHIVGFAIENWWTGDLGSFLLQEPSTYNIQCVENCELAQISFQNMELLYIEIPKLERLFRIVIQRAYVASQKRIVNNLSLIAKENYLKFNEDYPQLVQRFPQYMIASYLGFSPEFLSKIRKDTTIS